MAKIKTIKLTDLQVNTENYRFEPVASQKEAIDIMVEDQGEKIFKLAEHIIANGLNPNDRIQVVSSGHDSSKFNVVEGNRRTIALKLLNNPDLIEGHHYINLKKRFKKLHDDNKKAIILSIECTIYENPTEADKWIKLKHGGQLEGIGTVTWTAQQIDRFEEKVEGKPSVSLQAIKLLEKSPTVPADLKSNLKNLKVSNLERLISDPTVRTFLGIEINNGIIQSTVEEKEVIKGLTHIAKDLLDPKFNVKKIYTKDDRTNYVNKIPKAHKPNISKLADKPWQFNDVNTPNAKPILSKPKPNPKYRKTLIPKSCSLKISKPKVNSLYHELIKLDVTNYTNASAIALRVFVELSIDSYIEEHNLVNTLSAAKSGMGFQQKINTVANHMETKKFADAAICKGIKSEIKEKNDIMGIDTWHAYVHNNKFAPKDKNLIITWDNIQSFIEVLWANVK